MMLVREELGKLMQARLGGTVPGQKIDELVEEILALESGWEEMQISHGDMGYSMSVNCSEICWLAEQVDRGSTIKMYRRKKPPE